eukprot:3442046-Alexandrium_andersonii.AAC.1
MASYCAVLQNAQSALAKADARLMISLQLACKLMDLSSDGNALARVYKDKAADISAVFPADLAKQFIQNSSWRDQLVGFARCALELAPLPVSAARAWEGPLAAEACLLYTSPSPRD